MKRVTNLMINEFKLKELGFDFMGYTFVRTKDLSFHHLIIPRRLCDKVESKGFTRENGAILKQSSSHAYLHTIELYDRDMFLEITKWMIEENLLGRLDIECLRRIRDVLLSFEVEYDGAVNNSGNKIIKNEFKNRISL